MSATVTLPTATNPCGIVSPMTTPVTEATTTAAHQLRLAGPATQRAASTNEAPTSMAVLCGVTYDEIPQDAGTAVPRTPADTARTADPEARTTRRARRTQPAAQNRQEATRAA